MRVFRLFAALTVVICGVLAGLHLSRRLSRRREILEEFKKLFSSASLEIAYTGRDLYTVFSDNFSGYRFDPEQPFDTQWREWIGGMDGICDGDRQLLIRFLDGLGKSDAGSQQRHFVMYEKLLDGHIRTAEKEIESKAKVYRVLPAAAGLVLAIFII